MNDVSLRTALFQRYTQLQMWLVSRAIWYIFLLYISTLVLFALLRMFTGISVKRIGYFNLRHIVITPQQGIEIRIGKLGISPHRPTVARPGFFTFIVANLEIIVDPNVTIERDMRRQEQEKRDEQIRRDSVPDGSECGGDAPGSAPEEDRAEPFAGIPLLPRKKPWIFKLCRWAVTQMRLFDVQFLTVTLAFTDVATIITTAMSSRLDLRKTRNYHVSNFVGTIDNYELKDNELPFQAKLQISDVYIAESLEDESPWQAFEDLKFDISGVLNVDEMRAKEIGVQTNCGIIQLDITQILEMFKKVKKIRSAMVASTQPSFSSYPSASNEKQQHQQQQQHHHHQEEQEEQQQQQQEPSTPPSPKPKVFSAKDKKRILDASMLLLHLVHKVQLNVGIFEVLRAPVDTALFAIRMKDMNLDVSRMNPQSSGFKLLYKEGDVAHQSVFTVASLTAAIDTGKKQEELLYVPLVTSLTRSNLFSQTLQFVKEDKQKNDAILKSSWVLHAPNLTIEEHQISTLVRVALGLDGRSKSQSASSNNGGASSLSTMEEFGVAESTPFQSLLPNIDLDLTINDPGGSLVCDTTDQCQDSMFVMSSNRVHLSLKSRHNAENKSYSGTAFLETSGDNGYYHSATENKIDIISSDYTQMTVRANTAPEFNVEIDGKQSNLHITALRHEIFCAIGQVHATIRRPLRKWASLHKKPKPARPNESESHKGSLRVVPTWLRRASFSADNSRASVATNQFRGQTYEILGLKLSTGSFEVHYDSVLSRNDLDRDEYQHYKLVSSSDGRRLRVSGSDIALFKADQMLLGQSEEPSVTAQHSVVMMPKLQLEVFTHDSKFATVNVNIEPRLRIDLNVNLILAFSVVREILDKALLRHYKDPEEETADSEQQQQPQQPQKVEPVSEDADSFKDASDAFPNEEQGADGEPPKKKKNHFVEYHNLVMTMPRALIKVDMPSDDQVMLELGSSTMRKIAGKNPEVSTDAIKLYSQHPFKRTAWCILASLYRVEVLYDLKAKPRVDDKIKLNVVGMRINVPYKFKLYRIIDNGITLAKAIKTLILQTKKMDWMIALDPSEIKGVPNIPRVRIKTEQLQLALENDYFESDLTLVMQTQRHIELMRRRKLSTLDARIKLMLREGMHLLANLEAMAPRQAQQGQQASQPQQQHSRSQSQSQSQQQQQQQQEQQEQQHRKQQEQQQHQDQQRQQQQHQHHNQQKQHSNNAAKPARSCGTSGSSENGHYGSEKIYENGVDMAKHMATGVRRTATMFFDNVHDSKSGTPDFGNFGNSNIDPNHLKLVEALKNVRAEKVQELLKEGFELGCPADDGDKIFTDHHPWLNFWVDPEFKEFRKLKVILHDGKPSKMTVDESRLALIKDFSRMWVDTIRRERKVQHLGVKLRRNAVFVDEFNPDTCAEENIIDYSQKPLSMSVDFRQLDLVIDKTTHDTPETLKKFLHDLGKGLPMDTRFSILVPLFIDLKAHGGLRVDLQDFPLPVLHFPPLARNQDPKTNLALQVIGDLVITEQLMATVKNIRKIFVPLRPLTREKQQQRGSDVIEVHRTLTPIKTFTDLKFHAGSQIQTRVCWCMAYKPGFHSVGESFSGFSKPPIDPSPALGFWDKIRLVLHARFEFDMPQSSLSLCLKSGKSPYHLLGPSSGFAFQWHDNVKVQINPDDDPKKLFYITSDVFELVVPDYMQSEKDFLGASPGGRSLPRTGTPEKNPTPVKVVFSFAQQTSWCLGMMFEKTSEAVEKAKAKGKAGVLETRDSDFRKHYDVNLCMPEYIKDVDKYDAYDGFRSDFIYMAISVISTPIGGPDLGTGERNYNYKQPNEQSGANKCAAHLTLGVIQHFKHWKDQFSGEQWPPIKTGSLFPDPVRVRPSNKTFSTALSTAEYQIALSPLDLSFFHQLRHHKAAENNDRCTGLKAKIEDFVFDWHTRREPPEVVDQNGEAKVHLDSHRRWRMKSYRAEVRLNSVQVRAVDAKLRTQSSKAALKALHDDDDSDSDADDDYSETTSSRGDQSSSSHEGRQTSDDQHYGPHYLGDDFWIDLDDYTDVGKHRHLRSRTPEVKVYPLLYAPQFNYLRSTDFTGNAVYVDPQSERKVPKFGSIEVHDCLFQTEQPERRQAELLDLRRRYLKEQISDFKASIETLELNEITTQSSKRIQLLKDYVSIAEMNERVLHEQMMNFYAMAEKADHRHKKLIEKRHWDMKSHSKNAEDNEGVQQYATEDPEYSQPFHEAMTEDGDFSLFRNRYIIHALHLKWNNQVRNLVYRLQTSLSEDKELDYVSRRRAVQYLEELVSKAEGMSVNYGLKSEEQQQQEADEQHRKKSSHHEFLASKVPRFECSSKKKSAANSELETDPDEVGGKNQDNMDADLNSDNCKLRLQSLFEDLREVSDSEIALKSHSISFLTPRIQLIAEENPTKCLELTARDIELQVIDTYAKDSNIDADSSNIERRYGAILNKSGIFVLSHDDVQQSGIDYLCLENYSGEEERSSMSWPPWIAIEMCYDPTPLRQFVIIEDISFGIRLNQPNDLHVEEGDQSDTEDSSSSPHKNNDNADDKNLTDEKDVQYVTSEGNEMHQEVKQALDEKAESARNKASIKEQKELANGEKDAPEDSGVPGIPHEVSQSLSHHGTHRTKKAFLKSLIIDAPQVVAIMDSVQFYTFYTVLVDLLTYRDPLIKRREQAIDRVFLSNDFEGDYWHTLERIERLQKDIRTILHLYERLFIMSVNHPEAREVKIHLIKLERELIRRQTQLTVVIRAFKAVLRKNMNTGVEKLSKWSLLADSIVFRMLSETGSPVAEVYLRRVHYSRLSNEDSGSLNRATLGHIYARNRLPGSTYPLMVANYNHEDYHPESKDAVDCKWTQLDRVGGIPVLSNAEVKLKPLHIQVEHGLFERMIDFMFPISHSKEKEEKTEINDDFDVKIDDDSDSESESDVALSDSEENGKSRSSQSSSSSPSKHHHHGLLHRLRKGRKKHKVRDEVDEMMDRASSYWSIRSLRIFPTQLTVSYKGKNRFSLLNLQNLTIPTPLFSITNKTCSKLDLIMRIRKLAIKLLLAQSGSIIGNKFTRHKNHTIEDDRDLGLERILTSSSRKSTSNEEALKRELDQLTRAHHFEHSPEEAKYSEEDRLRRHVHAIVMDQQVLAPVHRKKAQLDPARGREIIWGDHNNNGGSSKGIGCDSKRDRSSSGQSRSTSPHPGPSQAGRHPSRGGTPHETNATSNAPSKRNSLDRRTIASQTHAQPGSPRRLRQPQNSETSSVRTSKSSFISKIKKGFN